MALGRPLGAKLFLEGLEVPFIGATITSTMGQASIAYIDLVPHQKINDIKPRTKVELFVRNYTDEGSNPAGSTPFPYVLAWQGEVFGFTFGKTVASRSFSISCIDTSSYWDCCLTYYFNSEQSLGSGQMQQASGIYEFNDAERMKERIIVTTYPEASVFKTLMEEAIKQKYSDNTKKDFLGAFVAIYEYVGYVNSFFKSADQRLRISDQIILKSSGRLSELLDEAEGLQWFSGIPGKASGHTSLRGVINDLMSLIFHDFVSPVFPSAVVRSESFSDQTKKGLPSAANVRKTIGNFIFKPNLYMMPPPMCNIFFPDEYSSFQFSRVFFKEPTRMIYQPELPSRFGDTASAVYLPHVYQPDSFNYFMKFAKGDYSEYVGADSFEVPASTSDKHCLDDLPKSTDDKTKKVNYGKCTQQTFLTNEELIKGIWLYRESMMPAASEFRAALTDFAKKEDFTRKVSRYLFFKRRFQDRSIQVTCHLKLSVVPGFPVLILDDSDADQNMVAYCASVTHRIYATEGGYTNVQMSYARHIKEEDVASTNGTALLVPPWMDEVIFGKVGTPPESEAAKDEVASLGVTHISTQKLSDFYKSLLGDSDGAKALTNYFRKPDEVTLVGAVRKLQQEYRAAKAKGAHEVMGLIAKMTSRSYIKLLDYYQFLGAVTKAEDVDNSEWTEFSGDVFERKGKTDFVPVTQRRNVIVEYRSTLKDKRGFRG